MAIAGLAWIDDTMAVRLDTMPPHVDPYIWIALEAKQGGYFFPEDLLTDGNNWYRLARHYDIHENSNYRMMAIYSECNYLDANDKAELYKVVKKYLESNNEHRQDLD